LKEENENNSQLDKQTVHSQLPKGWEIKKLGEVCEVGAGNSAPQKKEFFLDGIFPFIRTSDVGKIRKGIIDSSIDYLNDEGIKKMRLFKKGTILFPKSGASTFLNHRVIMNIDGYVSSHLATIKPSAVLKNEFIWYYLILIDAKDLMQNVAYPSLKLSDIKQIKIPIPPLPEQKRIVSILNRAFEAIDQAKANAEQNLKNAKELFESYLNGVFENKSDDWEERTLGEVYDVRDGTHDSPKYIVEGFPLITSKNLKNGAITHDKVKFISESDYKKINKRSKVDIGDVLFAMIGTIGNPVEIIDEPNYAIKNVALFKVNKYQNSSFLRYYLSSPFVVDKMNKEAKGTTQKFVGLGYLRNFPILIPPLETQNQIVQKLDELQAETKKLEAVYQQKIDDLEELKKSVLQKAFNREL